MGVSRGVDPQAAETEARRLDGLADEIEDIDRQARATAREVGFSVASAAEAVETVRDVAAQLRRSAERVRQGADGAMASMGPSARVAEWAEGLPPWARGGVGGVGAALYGFGAARTAGAVGRGVVHLAWPRLLARKLSRVSEALRPPNPRASALSQRWGRPPVRLPRGGPLLEQFRTTRSGLEAARQAASQRPAPALTRVGRVVQSSRALRVGSRALGVAGVATSVTSAYLNVREGETGDAGADLLIAGGTAAMMTGTPVGLVGGGIAVAGGMLYQESETVRNAVDSSLEAAQEAASAVGDAAQGAASAVGDAAQGAASAVGDAWGGVTGFFGGG